MINVVKKAQKCFKISQKKQEFLTEGMPWRPDYSECRTSPGEIMQVSKQTSKKNQEDEGCFHDCRKLRESDCGWCQISLVSKSFSRPLIPERKLALESWKITCSDQQWIKVTQAYRCPWSQSLLSVVYLFFALKMIANKRLINF